MKLLVYYKLVVFCIIISVNYTSGAYSFTSLGAYANTNFTWTLGTPNVTIRFISDEIYNFNVSKTDLYWRRASSYDRSIGYTYYYSSCYDYRSSYSPFGISCSPLNKTHFVIDFVLKQQYSSNDVGIIRVRGYNSGYHYYDSTTITIKSCPTINDNEKGPKSQSPARLGDTALIQCQKGPVFRRMLTNSALHPIGRKALGKCSLFQRWMETDLKQLTCWKGETYDFSKHFSNQSSLEGETALFYCDDLIREPTSVSLSFNNMIINGEKFALFNKTLTQDDYNATVICRTYQGSLSNEKSMRLNVLFPPPNDTVYDYYVTMYSEATVLLTFHSNPPVAKCGSVKVSKDGKDITNTYTVNDDIINKVVLHFLHVTSDDLGLYNVTVTSCDPFKTTNIHQVRIHAGSNEPLTYTEKEVIISITFACVGILLLCIFAYLAKTRCMKKHHKAQKPTKKNNTPDVSCGNHNIAYERDNQPPDFVFKNQASSQQIPPSSRNDYYVSPNDFQQNRDSFHNYDMNGDDVIPVYEIVDDVYDDTSS